MNLYRYWYSSGMWCCCSELKICWGTLHNTFFSNSDN